MIDLILNEPQLLFSLALTAKTCLVTLALFLVAGPLAGYYLARAPGVAPRVLGFVITIPLEIFNAVSRADFDAANALCLLLSLFAAVIFLAAELLIRRSPRL